MATSARAKAVADRILKKNSSEPQINMMDYNASLVIALNYYNFEHDNKEKKRWFQEHFKRTLGFPLSEIHEREFRSVGTLCRILDNGNELAEEQHTFIKNEIERLRSLSKPAKAPVVVDVGTKVIGIQERMDKKVSEFLSEFNGMIDEFTLNREIGNVEKLINQFGINGPMGKKIITSVSREMAELEEVLLGKDKQLVEGYSNFKKTDLKKLLEIYKTLVAKLDQAKKVVVRKPRAKKEKPAAQIISKLKFLKENVELGLRSTVPTSIVGSTEVWSYNVKTKKLQMYKAVDGMTITVKGTSLLNYDTEASIQKTVRKPNELAGLMEKGKRAYATFIKAIKTKEIKANGRFNEDTMILAAFK